MQYKRLIVLGITLLLFTALAVAALAAPQAFSLDWWSVDGGGGTSSGGNYALSGTIAQPDAWVVNGGGYTLVGGFWSAASSAPPDQVYVPLIIR